jgi:cyclophilin family peptidyl-prolyl cis-trans isomerase
MARLQTAETVEAQQAILQAAEALRLRGLIPAARQRLDSEPYALRQAAAHALAVLEGRIVQVRKSKVEILKNRTQVLENRMAPAKNETTLRLRTTRGLIRARLWGDDAPRTVENLVTLVRRRFYDGLTFHRVVPDYVSQGGDPRGDGFGGPGYLIPCEIGMRRYQTGVIGMALAGRDTGGSQFFFTHAPQPHLDGRYTAFGEVIEGFDVVTQLIEGDVILEARIE